MLSALTPWAAINVSVKRDSSEMEKRVLVSKHKHLKYAFEAHLVIVDVFPIIATLYLLRLW